MLRLRCKHQPKHFQMLFSQLCRSVCSQLSCALLQVLDDSTDRTTRDLVDDKVVEWRERGVNIEVMRRTNRAGYKAGALKEVR